MANNSRPEKPAAHFASSRTVVTPDETWTLGRDTDGDYFIEKEEITIFLGQAETRTMKWHDEDQRNRFICALRTLEVMISFRKWTEACAIVMHELNWLSDPELECGPWESVYLVLAEQKNRA